MRSVLPPWLQGVSWWAWHIAGGRSQPDGGAAVVAESHREALGLGVQSASAAEVEGLGPAAQDGGDDPGGAGEAAGLGGGEVAAGVQGADPGGLEVGEELFEGHGDHDGGAAATGLGQGLAGDGLDELAERLPVLDLGRQVSSMSVFVCRTGEVRAISILFSAWPWKDGIRNRPWQVPASSSRIVKVTRRAAAASWSASTLPS